ncbi:hypothetical protein BE21_33795 [Sorangium cellulosum]|uniref:Secreted protein n=1 Tax=Sorangium cellulosum TaxID=56 RepID=A0A150TPK5_SORCE|nr:hypothetical protein BE21_33795 [Sorangium cellulosum]
MKSERTLYRASSAIVLVSIAVFSTGCFALNAAAAASGAKEREAQEAQEAKKEAPPIPEPGKVHDEALAKQLVDKMTSKGAITAAKVIFSEDDWRIERNENSGIVTGRVTNATVLYKKKDGKCTQDPSLLRQEFVGNEFVAPGEWALLVNEKYEIPCEKAGL